MPKTANAIAATRTVSAADLVLRWLVAPLFALLLLVPAIRAETITAHGISTFGQLKYPADYPHLDYVNPDAPKGGEISVWAFGSFDSMNPYSIKGRSGGLASVFFESLLDGTSDEIGSAYGLLAESLEYPEDRSWVIFNIRPEAKFSDGSPVTAEDVRFSYETFLTKGLNSFRAQLSKKVKAAEVLGTNQIKHRNSPAVSCIDYLLRRIRIAGVHGKKRALLLCCL